MISTDLGNITKYLNSKCKHPTTMKIQKLVYISYCWYLTCFNKKMFLDSILAFQDGPVVKDLFNLHRGKKLFLKSIVSSFDVANISKDAKIILDGVISVYGDKTGDELSELTHELGTPWGITSRNNVLSDTIILEYYTKNFPQITMLPIIKDATKLDLNFNVESIDDFIKSNPTYADRDNTYFNSNYPSHARLIEVGML